MELNEKEISEVAERVLASVRDGIKDQIADAFYLELSNYLHEHYENHKERIQTELIREIQDEFIKNPTLYKYRGLRSKLYEENKIEITNAITEDVIDEGISNTFGMCPYRMFSYDWRRKDGIVKAILANWRKLKEDSDIRSLFVDELNKRQSKIEDLEKKILELQEVLEK